MKIGEFDLDKKVMVVAEIGNNHEGSFDLAREMINKAAGAGAHAVKFQTIRAEHLVRREDTARFDMLKSFELSDGEFEKLAEAARDEGVIFLSTPFDLESAEFLNSIVPAFKIASGDNTFYPLIDRVATFGKPMMISTGLLGLPEIFPLKNRIEDLWKKLGIEQELAALHCVCSYPAPPEQAALGAITEMKTTLGCTVGYSDHAMGIDAAVLSVAAGARIIEKHFTVDKNYSEYRDHQLSADPEDMALLVKKIEAAEAMLGDGRKEAQDCEKGIEEAVRRSVVAERNLSAGEEVMFSDLNWVRPGGGLAPGDENLLVGKKLKREIRRGERITADDVE